MKKQIIGLAVCATALIGSVGIVEAQYTIAIDLGYTGCKVESSEKVPIGPGASKEVDMYPKSCVGGIGKTTGIKESDVNLGVGLELKDILEESGYNVVMLREDNDTETSSQERAIEAADSGADIFVRLYCRKDQSTSKRGAMMYLPSESNPYIGDLYEECDLLGKAILEYYCEYSGFQNSGIKYTDETVGINWSEIPVAQVMLGCISDSKDEARLADSNNWQMMAEGIAAGIEDYLCDDESDFVDEEEVEGWDDQSVEDDYYEDYDENENRETKEGELTADQVYDALYLYLDENQIDMASLYRNSGWLMLSEEDEDSYIFALRSYTGAYSCYYVDKVSGETYTATRDPMTDEMGDTEYLCDLMDYILDETDFGNLTDGVYFASMKSEMRGYPQIAGENFLGTLCEYEIQDGEIIIHGSLNQYYDESQYDSSKEGYLKNGKRNIVCDENTQYFTSGGTGEPTEYTREEFFQIIQETKDSGLGVIIEIQDGVAASIKICS